MAELHDRASLEQALQSDSGNARLHYLLGAELASAREYDRAIAEMQRAIDLEPSLHTARFQLGLLHLTLARPDLARALWAPLESQPDESLRLFKRGLEALIVDDFNTCIEQLHAGIRANTTNLALNRDMEMVIGKVRERTQPPSATPAPEQTVRTDFSLYEQTPR
jgi:tetratricopeptide (TPR) repeat protein